MTGTDRAVAALVSAGGDLVDPPVLIRAKVPLELSGEAVRNRICTFVDPEGREWALRPDMTLVIAQAEVAARHGNQTEETIRRYAGPVFRMPATPSSPVEYDQVGLEKFGAPSDVEQDVWLFDTLISACQDCGVTEGRTQFGDLSIFPAFVDAIDLSPDVAAGLKRAFRQEGGVRAYLSGQAQNQSGLSSRLSGMSRDEIAAFTDDIFAMTNIQPVGTRGADEIVERLFERSHAKGATVSDAHRGLLEQILALDVPLAEAVDALQALARAHQLKGLDDILAKFRARADALLATAHANFLKSARFATRFGRRFTYYDGFVFEVTQTGTAPQSNFPFLAGGRYDSLLSDLSNGAVEATGLGGIVVPHLLPNASGGES